MRLIAAATMSVGLTILVSARVDAQLVDNHDNTITDTKTGKMWLKRPVSDSTRKNWTDARSSIATLSFAGHADWRLPAGGGCLGPCAAAELFGLFNAYGITAVSTAPFENLSDEWWTNSESPTDASKAIAFNAVDPAQNYRAKTTTLGVWAVRDVPGGPAPVPIDVFVADCQSDTGTVPSACPLFESVDIFIDNDDDGVIDRPVYDETNRYKARIHNNSKAWAMHLRARFYRQDCGFGATFPATHATLVAYLNPLPAIPPQGQLVIEASERLPTIPASHWCVGVALDHADDPGPPAIAAGDPRASNNVAAANLEFIAGRAGGKIGSRAVWIPRLGWVVVVFAAVAITYYLTRRRSPPASP